MCRYNYVSSPRAPAAWRGWRGRAARSRTREPGCWGCAGAPPGSPPAPGARSHARSGRGTGKNIWRVHKIFAVPTSTGVAPCTLVTVRACRAPGQSSSAQVRRSRPCAALKWSRVGSSLWSRPWLGGPELDVLELKERSGKPCRGMLACRLCVSCSSSWKTQVL